MAHESLLRGAELTITVEAGGYVKAYARPPAGIISYGLQGRIRDEIAQGVHKLVDEFLQANSQVLLTDNNEEDEWEPNRRPTWTSAPRSGASEN